MTPYLAPDATALGQIFWYTVEGEGYDLGRLRAIQDWYVRYQINSVPGVAQVASVGGLPDRVPDRRRSAKTPRLRRHARRTLRRRGPLELRRRRPGHPKGKRRVPDPQRRLDPLASRDIENIVVKTNPETGTPVYVSNLATVGLRQRVPPQRVGEERQRSGRRRGDDALRRKPAGRHRGASRRRSSNFKPACPRACGSSPSTTARG